RAAIVVCTSAGLRFGVCAGVVTHSTSGSPPSSARTITPRRTASPSWPTADHAHRAGAPTKATGSRRAGTRTKATGARRGTQTKARGGRRRNLVIFDGGHPLLTGGFRLPEHPALTWASTRGTTTSLCRCGLTFGQLRLARSHCQWFPLFSPVLAGEGEFALCALTDDVDRHVLATLEIAVEDSLGELVLDVALDGAAQRPGTEHRVIAAFGHQVVCRLGELDVHVLVGQPRGQLGDHEVHDLVDLLLRQLGEDDDVIHTVEELGAELLLEFLVDLRLHPVVTGGQVPTGLEPGDQALGDVPGTEVGGPEADGVLEGE